jgi:hypothetical protein
MLGKDAASVGNWTPKFRDYVLTSLSRVETSMCSIYPATQRRTQNNGILRLAATANSKLEIEKFTAPQPEIRLIPEIRTDMFRPHCISVLL